MQITKELLQIILSWPTVVIISIFVLRNPIKNIVNRLIKSDSGKAKIGPIEIELGKLAENGKEAVNNINKINHIMAESRILELEITQDKFGTTLPKEQQDKMGNHILELKKLTNIKEKI